jgi:hypothetical protein
MVYEKVYFPELLLPVRVKYLMMSKKAKVAVALVAVSLIYLVVIRD